MAKSETFFQLLPKTALWKTSGSAKTIQLFLFLNALWSLSMSSVSESFKLLGSLLQKLWVILPKNGCKLGTVALTDTFDSGNPSKLFQITF